jgi:membrane-associated phospholipid phosphatase
LDTIYQSGIAFIQSLQNLGGWLASVMNLFTLTGEENFFMMVMPLVYWAVDPVIGLRMGVLLLVSGGFNSMFKLAFHGPRPFWLSTGVKALRFEGSFGIPSGHAQNAAAVWGVLAASLQRGWAWIAAGILIFLVGFSRLVLGVHFPTDVLAGWLIGVLLVWVALRLEKPVLAWLKKMRMGYGVLAILLLSLILILMSVLARLSLAGWQIPAAWMQNASLAYPNLEPGEAAIDALGLSGVFTVSGTFFGMAAGAFYLSRRGGFKATGSWVNRVLRSLLGLVGVIIIWQGLGLVFPDGETLVPFALRFVRYGLVGGWVAAFAPMLFIRFKLAEPARP